MIESNRGSIYIHRLSVLYPDLAQTLPGNDREIRRVCEHEKEASVYVILRRTVVLLLAAVSCVTAQDADNSARSIGAALRAPFISGLFIAFNAAPCRHKHET
jgi:hypothetical protein